MKTKILVFFINLIVLCLNNEIVIAQDTTITIGTSNNSSNVSPIWIQNGNGSKSRYMALYTPSEVKYAGKIKEIRWLRRDCCFPQTNDVQITIYLEHTTMNSISGVKDQFKNEIMNPYVVKVYENFTHNIRSDYGWQSYITNGNFIYNGTDNLLLMVDGYMPSDPGSTFMHYSTSTPNKSASWVGYGSQADYYNTTTLGFRANIQLVIDTTFIVGINDFTTNEREVSISPNPFTSSATLRVTGDKGQGTREFTMYDLLGREVTRSVILSGAKNLTIHRNNLPAGMYLYKVTGDKGQGTRKIIATGKIIIQ